ncbi:HAD-IC family P-type ATPase [Streptomyces venezuelae]|uniref:Magnesium-transporting ATPase, P-type 1 n=2 Tax=Streptomyces venezuelae TaxID=54571 RepID=A0A5P2BG38_STRVZ|nr:HAD-IC family P-type ATPase [Streptomyces venezuelae]QES29475.1 magnesium-translocating P-type ATPase [Streptomyces venezuelae]
MSGPTTLQVLRSLETGPRGLTEEEADARLARHGPNVPPVPRTVSWRRRFVRGLRDPFTAVLFCLGIVSAGTAAWGTTCVITVLVAVSCALRATGEHRADRAMAALRDLVPTTATVVRRPAPDEREPSAPRERAVPAPRELPAEELVPGDIIRLAPGDVIPADGQVLTATGLSVDEAPLTGESSPTTKEPWTPTTDPGEGTEHLCFQGSSVTAGGGTAVVTATGRHTRFASTTHEASGVPGGERAARARAFDRSVHGISWTLVRFMLLTPPLVLVANAALRDRGLETLPFAVAVAVGLTPEMLPVVVTMCLARGAAHLARAHGVIVRRLPALHDLGAMDVLCVDKTGTLTQGRPVVDRSLDTAGRDAPEALDWAAVNAWWTLRLADPPAPDALDEAILTTPEHYEGYEGIAALPFDPVRRLATAVVTRPGAGLGVHTLVVKGAVENVLELCALPAEERTRLQALASHHAAKGLRVLAVATADRDRPARRRGTASHPTWSPSDIHGLTLVGFVTFRDAPDPAAGPALRALADRGVTVKILTGDHPGTAARVRRDLALPPIAPDAVRTAEDIDAVPPTDVAALARLAHRTTVFADCTPAHKARVVAALRAHGHTTGFLGDGVNDLPALHAADVGLAPHDAVPAAREAADVVLPRAGGLAAIDHAVTAGRSSGVNIATYLRITLSSNLGNVIAMLTAALLLPFLPMLPAQVLVQNLCFDAAQLAFAHERPAPAALSRPTTLRPRAFLRLVTGFGVLNAVADLATFAVLALAAPGPTGTEDESLFHAGWFTENLLTQSLAMLLMRGAAYGTTAAGRRATPVTRAALALATAGILIPLSPLGPPLGMTPLPPTYYALLTLVLPLYGATVVQLRNKASVAHGSGGSGRGGPQ